MPCPAVCRDRWEPLTPLPALANASLYSPCSSLAALARQLGGNSAPASTASRSLCLLSGRGQRQASRWQLAGKLHCCPLSECSLSEGCSCCFCFPSCRAPVCLHLLPSPCLLPNFASQLPNCSFVAESSKLVAKITNSYVSTTERVSGTGGSSQEMKRARTCCVQRKYTAELPPESLASSSQAPGSPQLFPRPHPSTSAPSQDELCLPWQWELHNPSCFPVALLLWDG